MKRRLTRKGEILKLIVVSFIILLLTCCYLIPCNLDSGLNELKEKQKDSFFWGSYTVEKNINNKFKTNNIIIKLNKDGTLKMNNIPIEIFDIIKSGKEINVEGTWKQNFLKNHYYLPTDLEFNKKDNFVGVLRTIQVYVKNNKPVLLISYGDPDQCRAIRFIKK
ncbi:MAG: hypothetical protein ACPGUU_08175 [Flavobacteriaceae bacterium]